jgi:hypothetical protein
VPNAGPRYPVTISIADARELLGSVGDGLTDSEVEALVADVQAVAQGLVAAFINDRECSEHYTKKSLTSGTNPN